MLKKVRGLILAVLALGLVSCNGSKKTVMDYFEEVDGDISDMQISTEETDEGNYLVYADNVNDDIYIGLDLSIYEEDNLLESYSWKMIRPRLFKTSNVFEKEPTHYSDSKYKFYKLKKPVDVSYSYYYNISENLYVDIYKTGGFTESEMEEVMVQEYVIAKAIEEDVVSLIFIDYDENSAVSDLDYTYDNVQYIASFDFENKVINLEKITEDGSDSEIIKTVKMDF